MNSISLYINKGSWLNRLHPYTKLLYILTAILVPLIGGKLWLFPVMITASLCILASGRILGKAMPLVLFSFTLILVIFLIQGLFNHDNRTVMFSIGVITFYREGVLFAVRIGCNILNMLLSFGIFVLTTSPQELVDELEKSGGSGTLVRRISGADASDRISAGVAVSADDYQRGSLDCLCTFGGDWHQYDPRGTRRRRRGGRVLRGKIHVSAGDCNQY